jgi:protein SCO1
MRENQNKNVTYRIVCALLLPFVICLLPSVVRDAGAVTLPGDSIYQLEVPLTDQNGRTSLLADHRGHPVIVTMFYSSCQFVCPRIVEALKKTEKSLTTQGVAVVPIVMITFDPARDDVATLKHVSDERSLNPALWTLARADPSVVRKLAASLQIQYRELPSGDFNHTSVLVLLDGEGRAVAKTFVLGEADPEFVKQVKRLMSQSQLPRTVK